MMQQSLVTSHEQLVIDSEISRAIVRALQGFEGMRAAGMDASRASAPAAICGPAHAQVPQGRAFEQR
jgi:hypothetical protein